MLFLCDVDLGQNVPSTWKAALDLLKMNYTNSLVISSSAEILKDIVPGHCHRTWGKIRNFEYLIYFYLLSFPVTGPAFTS